MDIREFRGAIFHMAARGRSAKDIYGELKETHGTGAASYATVARWCQEHRFGRTDLANRVSTRRPPEAITSQKIAKARQLVEENRSISLLMLSCELKLAHETVKKIMETHLGLKKMLARWLPHELSEHHRSARVSHAQAFLTQWADRWSRLTSRLITVDETWISYTTPRSRLSASE